MKLQGLLAAIIIGTCAAAAPFQNGSFESPGGLGSSAFDLQNNTTLVTGWTREGPGGAYILYSSDADGFGVTAFDGTHRIVFLSTGPGVYLTQSFDTVVGATYSINYKLNRQQVAQSPNNVFALTNLVEVANGSTPFASVTNAFDTANGVWFSGNTLTFVATSTLTTVRFSETTSDQNSQFSNWGLDLVSLTVDSLPGGGGNVPEPATWGVVALALGALSCRMNRKGDSGRTR